MKQKHQIKTNIVFGLIFCLFVISALYSLNAAPDVAKQILKDHGYTNIEITGFRLIGFCLKSVPIEGFKATDSS